MENKKNIYVLIGVGIVIIPLIIVAGIYIGYRYSHRPENKWQEYVELLKNKEYDRMYDLIDSKAQAKISREEFTTRNKNIYEGIQAKDIDVTIKSISEEDSNTLIKYNTKMNTIAGELNFDNSIKVGSEIGRGYTIKWTTKNIFPELGENDKVRVKEMKGRRGNITDRNGELLATDSYLSNVGIVPGKLGENKEENITKIASILQVSVDSINKSLSADYVQDDMFIPVRDIPYGDARVVELLKIPGVMIKDKESRVYPYGTETAHITGYVQSITSEELKENEGRDYKENSLIGKAGLEKMYEDKLRGIDGAEIYIQNSEGEKKSSILCKDPKNGEDLELTIDISIQKKLNEQLGSDKGCGVIMDSSNGEVLALSSTPSYDANDFIVGMSQEKWDSLNNNKNKPLYNRFQGTIVPGSSFKPIIAAIGVDSGLVKPDEVRKINGLKWKKDESFGDYYVTRTSDIADVNLQNALVYSDNIYFAQIATEMGSSVVEDKLKKFGFSDKIPFEFSLYNSQYSNDEKLKDGVQLADTGYGQGEVLVNPVHLTAMYTMFLNKGNIITPHLFKNYDTSNNIWKKGAISEASSQEILKDLIQVVENPHGTGHEIYTHGVKLAGKTGTAEIKNTQDDVNGTELGWFVGMTTEKENNIIITMMIEDVKNRGGSHYVVPKVGEIMKSTFLNQ